jgi:iron complex transport system ATP-binding protein
MSLQAQDIYFSYGNKPVLRGASLQVKSGQIMALLGGNGQGKSTLLKMMLGLLTPREGSVTLHGKAIHDYSAADLAQHIAYVPQVHAAPFPYTVQDVVMMGRIPANGLMHSTSTTDKDIVAQVIDRMGIAALAQHAYTDISGGQRQLTLIARALAQGATTLILDEPVNGLDYGNQVRLLTDLSSLANEGYTIVMTTHQPEHALLAATHVAILENGDVTMQGPASQIVTAHTISKLYGVKVMPFYSEEGHTAFYPVV